MSFFLRIATVMMFSGFPFWANAEDKAIGEKPVPYTELVIKQFVINSEDDKNLVGMPQEFRQATISSCKAAEKPAAGRAPVAPLVAAFGGIFIDWVFTRTMNRIKEKIKKRIEEYSAAYSNRPEFSDVLSHDSTRWDLANESCIVFQRFECTADPAAVKSNTAKCGDDRKIGLLVGMKLRKEQKFIRVVPFASQLAILKPKHDGGKVAIAATARVEAIGWNADDAGSLWKSSDLKLASIECDVSKPDKTSKVRTYDSCFNQYAVSDEAWKRAQVIPMPPTTAQAVVFTIGEVGEPSQGLKGFAEFMDASGGSMSSALSEAFQKKIKLKKE